MAKKFELNDLIDCPYCHKRGRLIRIYKSDPPQYDVVHKTMWADLPGKNGGVIHCEVLMDACMKGVKYVCPDEIVESDHGAEEDFVL